MPVTLVVIVASRVGIENTSSCPINRRSHAVTVKKSEFSCVFEKPVACRRASAWCRCRAREHNSLSAPALRPVHDRTPSTQQPAVSFSCRAKQYNKIKWGSAYFTGVPSPFFELYSLLHGRQTRF